MLVIEDLISKIRNSATTGLFTDYFDSQELPYKFIGDLKLNDRTSFILGQIRTINCETGPYEDENIDLGLGYLDECKPGEILVVYGSTEFAYFGELMSRLSKKRQLDGAIIFGLTRDLRFTPAHLPVWSSGVSPVDIKGRGRVQSVGTPIMWNGIDLVEGMWIAGDADGIVVFSTTDPEGIFEPLAKQIDHEERLIDVINDGASVKEILKMTSGF